MDRPLDRNILSKMPLAYGLHQIILDDTGRPCDYLFVDVNSKFEEFTGLTAGEIIGRRVTEVIPGIMSDEFDWIGAYGDVALSGEPLSFQEYSKPLDRWYSVDAYSPEKGYFVTLFTDITIEKNALDAASACEKKLRTYLDPAPLGILVVDRKGRLLEANPMACNMTGYSESELTDMKLQRLLDRNSRIPSLIFFKELQGAGEASCQLQVGTRNRDVLWISLYAKEMPDDKYIIYCQDITSYKNMEDELVKSELLHRTFINASADFIYLKDECLRYMIMNNALQEKYNLDYSEIIGKTDHELIPGDFSREAEATDQEVLDTKTAIMLDVALEDIGRSYETVKFPVPIGNLKTGVGAYIREVTEKKKQEKRLENLLKQTQGMWGEHDAVMLLIGPETGQIIDANPAAVSFYGYSKEELLSLNVNDLNAVTVEDTARLYPADTGKHKIFSFPHRLKNGERRIVDVYTCPISYNNEKVLFSIIFDVTEREQALDEIKYLSFHDHLTGLYNRRYFDNVLKLMNDERFMPLAVIMADVNGLKLINDSFGHAEGDALLKKAAEVITEGCRKDDITARIGGDEFVVILPNTDESGAQKIVRRICELQSQVYIRQLALSMSFGCAVKYDITNEIDMIVSEAENRMYKNKMYESATTRKKTVSIIMKTLYEKCGGESEHAGRVSKIAEAIALAMGLSAQEISQITTAALLHDIGKIGIDDNILNKPGLFSKADREEIEKHSESGWRILINSDEYADLADYVLYHHEFFDGKGYPRGIKGDTIPLISKIIAISDAYDAMTSDRPYRKAYSPDDAAMEIKKLAGTQFDPEVVRVFLDRVFSEGKIDNI